MDILEKNHKNILFHGLLFDKQQTRNTINNFQALVLRDIVVQKYHQSLIYF